MTELYTSSKERPSLIKINQIYKSYGFTNTPIVEGHSSGDDTDIEEKETEASIKDVVNTMIDYNSIQICENPEEFPHEAHPTLLFAKIDEWMTPYYMKIFIEETPCLK